MSKLWLLFASGLVLLGVMAGCSKVSANQNYATPGQSINARVGDTFTIELKTNPTTGYDWVYADNNAMVKLQDETYKADNTGVIGSGGTDYFTFKVLSAGNTSLDFSYERSWETAAVQQVSFSLVAS